MIDIGKTVTSAVKIVNYACKIYNFSCVISVFDIVHLLRPGQGTREYLFLVCDCWRFPSSFASTWSSGRGSFDRLPQRGSGLSTICLVFGVHCLRRGPYSSRPIKRLDIPLLAFVLAVMKTYRCIYSSWSKHSSMAYDLVHFFFGRTLGNQKIGHTSTGICELKCLT